LFLKQKILKEEKEVAEALVQKEKNCLYHFGSIKSMTNLVRLLNCPKMSEMVEAEKVKEQTSCAISNKENMPVQNVISERKSQPLYSFLVGPITLRILPSRPNKFQQVHCT